MTIYRSMMNISKLFTISFLVAALPFTSAYAQSAISRTQTSNKLQRYHFTPHPKVNELGVVSKFQIQPKNLYADESEIPDTVVRVKEIIVEGVSVYTPETIRQLMAPYEGKNQSVKQLYAIADIITNLYQLDDYILSHAYVPEQNIKNGRVTIKVVEGGLGRVVLEGDVGGNASKIHDYAQNVIGFRPLTGKQLERTLMLIHDLPGINLRSYIMPTAAGLANADLIVQANHKKHSGLIGIDNRGSDIYGPTEIYGLSSLNSPFGFGELIEIEPFVAGPTDGPENMGAAVNVRIPIFANGSYVQGYLAYNKIKPGGSTRSFNLDGHALSTSLIAGHPIIRQLDQYLYGSLQFDILNSKEDQAGTPFIDDKIRALRANFNYALADMYGGENFVDLIFSYGLKHMDATKKNNTISSRSNAVPDFRTIRASIVREQSLDMITSGLALETGLIGQYSNNPLLSGEEFGLGGQTYLRAYDDYEIAGDSGFALKAELSYTKPLYGNYELDSIKPFLSYSYGKVYNNDKLAIEVDNVSIASLATGANFQFRENYFGAVTLAAPLTRDVAEEGNSDVRLFFQLGVQW